LNDTALVYPESHELHSCSLASGWQGLAHPAPGTGSLTLGVFPLIRLAKLNKEKIEKI
jgi:hypothetical protein